jgi:hypothetical protein
MCTLRVFNALVRHFNIIMLYVSISPLNGFNSWYMPLQVVGGRKKLLDHVNMRVDS